MVAPARSWSAARAAGGGVLLVWLAILVPAGGAGRAPQPPGRPAEPAKTVTIAGTCLDEAGKPLAGVTVRLYREDYQARSHEKLAERETKADGRFEFPDAPAPAGQIRPAIVVTKAGRGSIVQPLFAELLSKPLEFKVRPAGTLQGRVADAAGRPVAGARVWAAALAGKPVEGVASAVTDADGKYAIPDMGRWTDEDARPKPIGNGLAVMTGGVYFDVAHPDYARERPTWNRIPATVDVVVRPGGGVAGRVTDRVTGKPAAGVTVSLQGTKDLPTFDQARTGPDGRYEVRSLKPGKYNLWADAPDRACGALDSLEVTAGTLLTGQDLDLVEGGWVEGRVVDAATGEPVAGAPDRPLAVGCYGPGRPKSGAACQSARVDADGRFKLRVAPGVNYPYLMTTDRWRVTDGGAAFEAGVAVKAGEAAKVEFKVAPATPR